MDMPSHRAGLRPIEPRRSASGDRLRLAICRLAGMQHSLDMLQLFVKFPTVVGRQLVPGRGIVGRFLGISADRLSAAGTAERLLIARRKRRHILAASFTPHRFLASASGQVNYTDFAVSAVQELATR
jgi:hypothetical protein